MLWVILNGPGSRPHHWWGEDLYHRHALFKTKEADAEQNYRCIAISLAIFCVHCREDDCSDSNNTVCITVRSIHESNGIMPDKLYCCLVNRIEMCFDASGCLYIGTYAYKTVINVIWWKTEAKALEITDSSLSQEAEHGLIFRDCEHRRSGTVALEM